MADLTSLVTGLSQGIDAYLGKKIENQATMTNETYKNQLELQRQSTLEQQKGALQLSNKNAEETYKLALEGKVTPELAEKEHPELAQKAKAFYDANGRYATPKEGKEMGWFSEADDMKSSKQQDALEKQFQDRMTMVRGDQSLMRAEKQRDAAGMAYDTIAKARSENRDLTQLEQSDLIGQLWQARAGKAPTDQDMKLMQDMTAKRGFNHMITYLTGDPNLIGASTPETLANLEQFIDATGQKSDQQWEGYMASRRNPPSGLDPDRAAHVLKTTRGLSYAEQKATSDKTYQRKPKGPTLDEKRAALRKKLEL